MTKKDYELIASVFKDQINSASTHQNHRIAAQEVADTISTATLMADRLEKENPRFDRSKFLKACDIKD